MKRLVLLRHAKADQSNNSLRDFDRPLTSSGENEAKVMGQKLLKNGLLPEYVLSSPALRAKMTVELFLQAAKLEIKPLFEQGIYGATSAELLKLVRTLPANAQLVLMVGHNPGFEGLNGRLSGSYQSMPTAAITCIEFEINNWSDVEDGLGRLKWLLTPKEKD